MGILKITYSVIILFLSGIGSVFKYKWLEAKKKSLDDKYFSFFEKHKDSSNDTIVLALKPVFYFLALFILLEALLISWIFNVKESVLIAQMIFAFWGLVIFARFGMITTFTLNDILKDVLKDYKKAFNVLFVITLVVYCIYLAIKLMYSNLDISSDEMLEQFIINETSNILTQIPTKYIWLSVLIVSVPFLLIFLFFALGRLTVLLFRLIARKTIRDSKKDPLKIITWLIAFAFIINTFLTFHFY